MKYVVTVEMPKDCTDAMMIDYVQMAVKNWFTRYMDDHPLAGFDPSKATVLWLDPIIRHMKEKIARLEEQHRKLSEQLMVQSADAVLDRLIPLRASLKTMEEL